MKKLNIKVLSLLVAAAGMFAGCSQEELVKSEIDNANYPKANVELSALTVGTVGTTTADLSFDVTGYTTEVLEIAVVYATTPDFADAKPVVFTDSVAETINMQLKGLSMETTYYATAYAYMRGATVYADTVSFTTSAEPISKEMLNGKAYGKAGVADYWGDVYDFNFTLSMGEGDTIYVNSFDPYFAANGFTADKGVNILTGILAIAEDGKTATITCESGQEIGYKDCVFVATTTGEDIVPIVFELTQNGAKMSVTSALFGVLSLSQGWYTLYPPTEWDAL